MVNGTFARKLKRTAVFLLYTVLIIAPAIPVHGKTCFPGGNTDGKEFCIFCIGFVKRDDTLAAIKSADLIVNAFDIISFVSEEGTFRNRQEVMGVSKNIQSDGGISDLGGGSQFRYGKTGYTVHKDMVFVSPIEFKVFYARLIGCGMNTEFTVFIGFGLVVRLKLM